MKEAEKVIEELEWFRSVLRKGGKIPEYYEAQADILTKAIKLLEQLEQRWIPSGEKPPEKESYLVWMPFAPQKHRMTVAEYCGGYWNIKTPISAWMPLPEPYQEGEKDG